MDQKEIDALISQSQGTIKELSKKQEVLAKQLTETEKKIPRSSSSNKGKVIGQLSRVTEEAEAGTNMVMGYMENVLSVISRQSDFIKDITIKFNENPHAINTIEVLTYLNDNTSIVEELIYKAMDAFQFQDIGRQKLMKVMYTLSKLNEYLNDLLGGQEDTEKPFGREIESKTMQQDKEKEVVDSIISEYKNSISEANDSSITSTSQKPHLSTKKNDEEINITKDINENNSKSPIDNKDIDDIIAQFHKNKKEE